MPAFDEESHSRHCWRWTVPAPGCFEVGSFVCCGQVFRPASCALISLVEKTC